MQPSYDVVVIGGGPAGMMAAGRAAQQGRSILLLEKNPGLGKKLLITGGGRCNLTNNKTEVRTMLSEYKGNDQFLFSAFAQFNVKDTLEFFNSRGLATKEENEGRIFPVTDSAKSVFDVLVKYMKATAVGGVPSEGGKGVEIRTGTEVKGISVDPKTGEFVINLKSGLLAPRSLGEVRAKACILATGGVSRPETGSTGEGFKWLKGLGHTVIDNDFSLVPVALKDAWVKKLGGVTLKDVKITVLQNNQKQTMAKGNMMFAHFGFTGPLILNLSREIGDLLKYGEVALELDLFPNKDNGALHKELQELLASEPNKKLKNVLGKLVPSALSDALLEIVEQSQIPNAAARGTALGETSCNLVSKESRQTLVALMKKIPLTVSHLLGADKAVISSGGVALEEVDFKTMQSRKIPNLYLVGDVLNIDRPSGGYSLQLCWTTGWVAGSSCG